MPQVELSEIFPGQWGICEARRAEIENGYYGAHDRVLKEELDKQFPAIEKVAEDWGCHRQTATKHLTHAKVRYLVISNQHRYYINDVLRAKSARPERKKAKAR